MIMRNYRCVTIPGSGIVARWPGEILLCVGPTDVLEDLMLRSLDKSIALRVAAQSVDWATNGGGYVSLLDTSTGIAVEGDGFCDVVIDGKRQPVTHSLAPDGLAATCFLDRRTAIPSTEPLDSYLYLSHGVVRGSGLMLIPDTARVDPEPDGAEAPSQSGRPAPSEGPDQESSGEPGPSSPAGNGQLDLNEPIEPRDPLTVAGESEPVQGEPEAGQPIPADRVLISGRACPVKHVNHPEAQFCISCGRALNATAQLVDGPRPSLGSILFDDGPVHDLLVSTRVGREPQTGDGYNIIVIDSDDVSRQHLTIELREWDVLVVDDGSANNTFVQEFGRDEWRALTPKIPYPLQPGTSIRLGHTRQFMFQASHALPPTTT